MNVSRGQVHAGHSRGRGDDGDGTCFVWEITTKIQKGLINSRHSCQNGVVLKVYTVLVGKAGFLIYPSQSEKLVISRDVFLVYLTLILHIYIYTVIYNTSLYYYQYLSKVRCIIFFQKLP